MSEANPYLGPSPRVVDAELRVRVGGLRAQGLTHRAIAEQLGISERSARRAAAVRANVNRERAIRTDSRPPPLDLHDVITIAAEDGAQVAVDVSTHREDKPDSGGHWYMVAVDNGPVDGYCVSRVFREADAAARFHGMIIRAAARGEYVAVRGTFPEQWDIHSKWCAAVTGRGPCPADAEDE